MISKNSYGIGEIIKNSISLIYTKIFYNNARLIRRPIFVRGKSYLRYEKGFTTGYNCRLEMFDTGKGNKEKLIIGLDCKIGDYVHIAVGERIKIGNNVLMGSKILITDLNHGNYLEPESNSSPDIPPDKRPLNTSPIEIGDNVWIGDNACILPGVKIGNGCIIGANSTVNKSIPNNCIVVGSPAKIIKVYNYKTDMWEKVQ